MLPSLPLKQPTLLWLALQCTDAADGYVITAFKEAVQLLLSVTTTV